MRIAFASIVLVSLILCSPALAQETTPVQEPEYLGTFFALDSASGRLTPLERQSALHKIRTKAFGFGGAKGWYELKGEKSPVRFTGQQVPEFVVLVSSQQIDPQGVFKLYAWVVKKGARQLPIDKAGSMGLSGKSLIANSEVPFDATKYGKSSFKIKPGRQLAPGEYTLTGPDNKDRFCFGIDADTSSQPAAPPR